MATKTWNIRIQVTADDSLLAEDVVAILEKEIGKGMSGQLAYGLVTAEPWEYVPIITNDYCEPVVGEPLYSVAYVDGHYLVVGNVVASIDGLKATYASPCAVTGYDGIRIPSAYYEPYAAAVEALRLERELVDSLRDKWEPEG